MNRRSFLASSSLVFIIPVASTKVEDRCLKGLDGVDAESVDSPYFTHYHQLIIPVSDLVNPPADGIHLTTSVMDQGSYDNAGLEAFAKSDNTGIAALRGHDHLVHITHDELTRIAKGEKNVEIKVFKRDGKTYVHNFLITAPRSLLAIVEKERK